MAEKDWAAILKDEDRIIAIASHPDRACADPCAAWRCECPAQPVPY